MDRKCETCKFFDLASTKNDKYGYCRRFPPSNGKDVIDYFPTTRPSDWCGEYREFVPQVEKEKNDKASK